MLRRAEVTKCQVQSREQRRAEVSDRNNPQFDSYQIRDSKQVGVCVYVEGLDVLTGCSTRGNVCAGVQVQSGSSSTVQRCEINGNKSSYSTLFDARVGVLVFDAGAQSRCVSNGYYYWDLKQKHSQITQGRVRVKAQASTKRKIKKLKSYYATS